MKMKIRYRRAGALILSAVMALSLVSCAGDKDTGSQVQKKEFVYVPEYVSLGEQDEDSHYNFYNMRMSGNSIYYTCSKVNKETKNYESSFMEYSLETKEEVKLPFQQQDDRNINSWMIDKDGNFYTVEYYWGRSSQEEPVSEEKQYLCKYDVTGKMFYEQDITKILASDENNSWVRDIAVDHQGRLYLISDNLIRLFDAEGNLKGSITQDKGWISSIGTAKDGKVYICYYDDTSSDGTMALTELDFDGKKLGATYSNFPNASGSDTLVPGIEKDFLVNDDTKLYEYDLATQTYEVVMDWLDSDINGTYVSYVGVLENGKLLVVISDWETDKTELAYLTKTAASELPEKKQLVIGTLYSSQAIQAAAVNFNKNSDTYHVSIKTYIDQNHWTDTSWEDGITALNNDILSKSSCPDILDLSGLNVQQLAVKGVFEDLNSWLEKSSAVSKEDFLESIVAGYTFDGKLVTIPKNFQMSTLVGKAADLGTKMGWTLKDLMAYAQANPEASLFDGLTGMSMISSMLQCNQSSFIDWESGKCNFESEEFKALLTFANTLPAEYDWQSDERSTPVKIQAGDVLMDFVGIYDLDSVQQYEAMFNEPVTYIGYPNSDGTSGCFFRGEQMYAIASKSDNKEGAWAFVESCLLDESGSMFSWGLPTSKNALEKMIEEKTKVEYVTDENGQPVLDENGNPITMGTSSIGYGDWEYTYHVPTQEEINLVKELIAVAVPAYNSDEEILKIIEEEIEAYFQKDKSVDEVASVIQSRVQVYVDENR